MLSLENKSLTNSIWLQCLENSQLISQACTTYNISPIVARILLNRGINLSAMSGFLNPKLKDQMQDPLLLKDMQLACTIIMESIARKEKIYILGDYDVDGITSTTLLYKYLKNFHHDVNYYIPNRYTEGYGVSMTALDNIIQNKGALLILLDNGSSAVEEIKKAKNHNIKVVVIDHHEVDMHNNINADAFVNPKQFDDSSEQTYLCTVGLVFLFIVALNRILKNQVSNKTIDIMQYLDLVALGTVCDIVPLVALNRSYVFQGLKIMQKRNNVALTALMDNLKINKPVDVETLGFSFGPCINAGSRMGNSELPLKLLLSEDSTVAFELSNQLIALNNQRQNEESKIIDSAVLQIEENNAINVDNHCIFVGNKDWISGVIGIIAGRVKDIYHKPTCIYSINEETGIATASGRSIAGIDLGSIIIGAKQRDLLIKGGGHAMAVGFSFNVAKKDEIFNFINHEIAKKGLNKEALQNTYIIDDVLAMANINQYVVEKIMILAPFGMNFREPLFMLREVKIKEAKQIGQNKNHLQVSLTGDGLVNMKAFCYKCIPGILGEHIISNVGRHVNLVVSLSLNFYQGKNYTNLIIKDIATYK